jgi:hypothetical protein
LKYFLFRIRNGALQCGSEAGRDELMEYLAHASVSILKISRLARVIGVFGCVVGIVSLAAFFSGHLRLDVHGFGLFIFAQSAWVAAVGALMCRAGDSTRAA